MVALALLLLHVPPSVASDRVDVAPTQAGMMYFIPVGIKHRLENTGNDDLVVIEVQTGTSCAEEDIVRYEDSYGRV